MSHWYVLSILANQFVFLEQLNQCLFFPFLLIYFRFVLYSTVINYCCVNLCYINK